jgi:hypothetical protein
MMKTTKPRPSSAQPHRTRPITPARSTVTVAQSLPKKKKSEKANQSSGDIIGHSTPHTQKIRTTKKLSDLFSYYAESKDPPARHHLIRAPESKYSSSDSGNIITNPPLEQEFTRRKRPTTFQIPTVREDNILSYDSNRRIQQVRTRPQRYTSHSDLLAFDANAKTDHVIRRPASPMRMREYERNVLNPIPLANAPLIPATRYTSATNKTIEMKATQRPNSSLNRSTSMSQILNWGL